MSIGSTSESTDIKHHGDSNDSADRQREAELVEGDSFIKKTLSGTSMQLGGGTPNPSRMARWILVPLTGDCMMNRLITWASASLLCFLAAIGGFQYLWDPNYPFLALCVFTFFIVGLLIFGTIAIWHLLKWLAASKDKNGDHPIM